MTTKLTVSNNFRPIFEKTFNENISSIRESFLKKFKDDNIEYEMIHENYFTFNDSDQNIIFISMKEENNSFDIDNIFDKI